jgi:hypothetical protein
VRPRLVCKQAPLTVLTGTTKIIGATIKSITDITGMTGTGETS